MNKGKTGQLPEPFISMEDERDVLGAAIGRSDVVAVIGETLTAGDFSHEPFRMILRAMLEVTDSGSVPDRAALVEKLTGDPVFEGCGGRNLLVDTEAGATPLTLATVREKCVALKNLSSRRRVRELLVKAQLDIDDPRRPWSEAASQLRHIGEEAAAGLEYDSRAPATLAEIARNDLSSLLTQIKRDGQAFGIQTGFPLLDGLTGGFIPGTLTVLAAQTSVGKSALAGEIALRVARAGVPVAFFSLEMPREIVLLRMACRSGNVDMAALMAGRASSVAWRSFSDGLAQVVNLPIVIDGRRRPAAEELRWRIRSVARSRKSRLVIVDYLQLVVGRGGTLNEQVASVSGELQAAAGEIGQINGGAVLALSQLNRRAADDEEPQLCHLRDSGAIEQDADTVWLVWRPKPMEGLPHCDFRALKVAKNRNGPLGRVDLEFIAACTGFEEKGRR